MAAANACQFRQQKWIKSKQWRARTSEFVLVPVSLTEACQDAEIVALGERTIRQLLLHERRPVSPYLMTLNDDNENGNDNVHGSEHVFGERERVAIASERQRRVRIHVAAHSNATATKVGSLRVGCSVEQFVRRLVATIGDSVCRDAAVELCFHSCRAAAPVFADDGDSDERSCEQSREALGRRIIEHSLAGRVHKLLVERHAYTGWSVSAYRGYLQLLANGRGAVVCSRHGGGEQLVASSARFTIESDRKTIRGPSNLRFWFN
jgi:hypothetical protein